jgi:S1-C subfamily serine protease
MPERMIDERSIRSLFLNLAFNGSQIGTATGFVVRKGLAAYLVTNRHVVRGRRQGTDEILDATNGALPNRVVIGHRLVGNLETAQTRSEPLYDVTGQPLWLEHPVYGGSVDIAAVPLTQTAGIELFPYDPWEPGPAIAIAPATAISVIGYPFGVMAGGPLPVWLAGFVASEPQVDAIGLPTILIDCRTRVGSSGSPVIAFRSGGAVLMEDGATAISSGPSVRFLGVYSGRIDEQSDIGIVWKHPLIAEIIDGQQRPDIDPRFP